MKHTQTTSEDSIAMVQAAWQRLREQYLKLVERQKAGHPAHASELAQAFIDMNTALEAAMSSGQSEAPGESGAE